MVKEFSKMMLTNTAFNEIYEDLVTKSKSYTEAYEIAETVHQSIFGERRYSDYDSFRHVRNKLIKKS